MEIRKKLAYQFIGLVATILLIALVAIYFSFSKSRKEEFYDRMDSKAKQVAQMLVEIDEIDAELLKKIERNNPLNLANEKIVIYDHNNNIIFSSDENNTLKITSTNVIETRQEGESKFKRPPYEVLGQYYSSEYYGTTSKKFNPAMEWLTIMANTTELLFLLEPWIFSDLKS